MKYLLIRHAQTDANRLTRALFGEAGAPLNSQGKAQATALRKNLLRLGIDIINEDIAVSELLRVRQTAEFAGFKNIVTNRVLNEINTGNPQKTLALVAQAKLPEQAVAAAKAILNNPPKEKIWITHGLVIAALQYVLGQTNPKNFTPEYCEIREINL